jgi:hypothetical protein
MMEFQLYLQSGMQGKIGLMGEVSHVDFGKNILL